MFFEKKLTKIFCEWIIEAKREYKSLLRPYIDNKIEIPDEEYNKIYKEIIQFYFGKATDFVKNNDPSGHCWLRWLQSIQLQNVCNYPIDFENLSLGIIFVMTYYAIKGRMCGVNKYNEFNYANNYALNCALHELDEEYSN